MTILTLTPGVMKLKLTSLVDSIHSSPLLYAQFFWSMPGRREDFLKEIMHFTIWLTWSRPSTSTPILTSVMKFTIWVDPPLIIITIHAVSLIYALEYRIRFSKIYFTHLPQNDAPLELLCLLLLLLLHVKFGKFLEMLMDDDGRQPIGVTLVT